LQGVGKSMAAKIDEIRSSGTLQEMQELLAKTPEGVVEMFNIKGIGPKKVRSIWTELGIIDIRELLLACENGEVAKLKGFGDKIQATIRESILFAQSNSAKLRMDKAETLALGIIERLEVQFNQIEIVGEIARKNEIVEKIQILVAHTHPHEVQRVLNTQTDLQQNEKTSSPFVWRGNKSDSSIPIEILICKPEEFIGQKMILSANQRHFVGNNLLKIARGGVFETEAQIYEKANVPYIIPEMREGQGEFEWASKNSIDDLTTWDDLRGILHNHSTYSDGKHSLEDMARFCKELGFEYLGIADHSKSATYARGLSEEQIVQQHAEIEKLNSVLAPFKILKGIESDILGDGSLDYSEDVLKSFDYVVASVHSNLKMTEEKAMSRLLRAIENPHTTILGHPTGRLLLSRAGYPVNHRLMIDACAANGVVIEINASPYRLDLDWRWIAYAQEKGVMLSVNPDAHEKDGYFDMHYGVAVGRKGGLLKKMTFNAFTLNEIESFLRNKK
jgi:DNA polymerase (family X)